MPYRNSKDDIHPGMIIMWSGLLSEVPDGWSICDGTNGTPDLREKFVRGANGEIGGTGGCECHSHTVCGCTSCTTNCCIMVDGGSAYSVAGYGHYHCLSTDSCSASNIPPYYELIFIRKD